MMLKNYISKLVCLATLCAFLLQPHWLEGMTLHKVHQQHHLHFSKTHFSNSCALDQSDNESESDEDTDVLFSDFPSKINLFFLVLAEHPTDAFNFPHRESYRLQDRPIWLTCRKLIL